MLLVVAALGYLLRKQRLAPIFIGMIGGALLLFVPALRDPTAKVVRLAAGLLVDVGIAGISGSDFVVPPDERGFGSKLLHDMVEHQFAGSLSHDWNGDGLDVKISLPLGNLCH